MRPAATKSSPQPAAPPQEQRLPRLFAGLFGAFLGLSLLKFGNPPIMEKWVSTPANIYEFVLGYPWPIAWAYALLGLVTLFGLRLVRWELNAPRWLLVLPLVWLGWQFVAATQTLDPSLTWATLKHLLACVLCFYLGFFSLSHLPRLAPFWIGILCAFLVVLAIGWEQHFGGLEETRRFFFLYIYPELKEIPPDYLKKVSSNRIFSTLFYPNALAGALLLLLPPVLGLIWSARERLTFGARSFLLLCVGTAGLACLFWSGSKGGWLLLLLLGLVALLRLRLGKRFKIALITALLLLGLAGFFWKYSGFFQKGATSVSARFDYWEAAAKTTLANPLFGTGPGTFSIPYQRIKRPESEMSRLVHNDYLEQASDSGLPGCLAYLLFMLTALTWSFRKINSADWQPFLVWLGVFGFACQGFMEFSLYIPALAWPAFALLGWLLSRPLNPIDNSSSPRYSPPRHESPVP